MTPVIASAVQLPFQDNEFDITVTSDVMEHIPPEMRKKVIGESLRVARKLAIFGFPCGQVAWESDRSLHSAYVDANMTPPGWLTEHMEAPFPEPKLFADIDGWQIQQFGSESITFHSWMMRKEMSLLFVLLSSIGLRAAPYVMEAWLRKADRDPYYRQIFALRRCEEKFRIPRGKRAIE